MASLGGLPTTTPAPAPQSWASALPSLATALVQARYQDKVLAENFRREKAGLKPLDTEQYAPGVKVGIDPATRRLVLWGVGLLVAGGLAAAALRRRKRGH